MSIGRFSGPESEELEAMTESHNSLPVILTTAFDAQVSGPIFSVISILVTTMLCSGVNVAAAYDEFRAPGKNALNAPTGAEFKVCPLMVAASRLKESNV